MSVEMFLGRLRIELESRGRRTWEEVRIAIATKRIRRNEEITASQLRVIAADGAQAGVMSRYDALQMANQAELDLVEVSPTA